MVVVAAGVVAHCDLLVSVSASQIRRLVGTEKPWKASDEPRSFTVGSCAHGPAVG